MKYTVEVDDKGLITLKKNEEIVLISNYSSRIAYVLMYMLDHNEESELLKTSKSPLPRLFEL